MLLYLIKKKKKATQINFYYISAAHSTPVAPQTYRDGCPDAAQGKDCWSSGPGAPHASTTYWKEYPHGVAWAGGSGSAV